MTPEKLLAFQDELFQELVAGTGLAGLLEKYSVWIDAPVVAVDTFSRVKAASQNAPHWPEGKILSLSLSEKDSHRYFLHEDGGGWEAFGLEITGRGKEVLGRLLVLEAPGEKLKEKEIISLGRQVACSCALEFARERSLLAVEQKYKDDFIFDLLYSNIEAPETAVARGELWGWQLDRPHLVVVFELDQYEHFSPDARLMEEIFELARFTALKIDRAPILMEKRGELVAILPVEGRNKKKDKARVKEFASELCRKVRKKISPRLFRAGIGRVYPAPTEIFRSYQEAKVALELGRLVPSAGDAPFFSDLGMVRLLYNTDRQELDDFYRENLGELAKYDQELGYDLTGTLKSYLVHSCDLKRTAQALFLHPNTLRYRLKKIEELLEIDLEDLDTKLDLMVAFKIKHLLPPGT